LVEAGSFAFLSDLRTRISVVFEERFRAEALGELEDGKAEGVVLSVFGGFSAGATSTFVVAG
jgi:hypothetical protein